MRTYISVILSLVLLAGSAAAQPQTSRPLAPGKPAGIAQAQSTREMLAVTGAGLALIVGFSILISGGSSDAAINAIAGGSNQLPTVGGGVATTTTTSSAASTTS